MTVEEFRTRIRAIEESYEFFLAFAAQGIRDDRESPVGSQLREFLSRTTEALTGLADGLLELVEEGKLAPAEPGRDMAQVLRRDAEAALAAVQLVRAREAIGSQLIDNLNASIHLRAILTDLFLIDDLIG